LASGNDRKGAPVQHFNVLPSFYSILIALLVVSSPAAALASGASPASGGDARTPAAQHQPGNGAERAQASAERDGTAFTPDQRQSYAERSQRATELRKYEGGDAIVITSGAVLVAALIVVLLVIV
jgi:hypothetical protein